MAISFTPATVWKMEATKSPPSYSSTSLLLSAACLLYLVIFLMPDVRRLQTEKSPDVGSREGLLAPDFHFDLPGVGPTSLAAFRGQVVLLNFWADWCGPCLEEMPSLKLLEKKLMGKRFAILAVNVNGRDAQSTVEGLASQLPKNVVWKFTQSEVSKYGVSTLPYSLLLDPSGVVHKVYWGSRDWTHPRIVEEIESLLGSS